MASEVDIRLYSNTGKRKLLPEVASLNFELLERGGMGAGDITLSVPWQDFDLDGTEQVDVRLFGQSDPIIYRGFVRVARRDVEPVETAAPSLQSIVEILNHYLVRWPYAYGGDGVDLAVIAADLLADFVTGPSNRLGSRITSTDLQTIGVELTEFDAVGRSVANAFNMLCDKAPGLAIWGVEAMTVLTDRLYLRPKPTATEKYYTIGGNISGFAYPKDTGQIINVIRLTGGPVKQPNLAYNPSFEEVAPAAETVGNLLLDYSFEDNDPAWTLTGARKFTGMDATAVGSPKSGKYWLELDQNTESGIQVVLASFAVEYTGIMWVRQETAGTGRQVKLTLEGLSAADAVVVTADTGFVTAADDWEKISVDLDPTGQPTVVKIRYRVETNGGTASNDGVLVDDTALIEKDGEGAVGWRRLVAGVANPSVFQWNYKTFLPTEAFHGGYMVSSDPSAIAAGTDYVEIRTSKDKRIDVNPNERYSFVGWFYTPSLAASITLGIIEYDGNGTNLATNESLGITINGGWFMGEFFTTAGTDGSGLTMNANTRSVELFVRHRDNDEILIDALYFGQGGKPPDFPSGVQASGGVYWAGENYERRMKTSDAQFTGGFALDAAADSSIADYGEREEELSNDLVIDNDSALTFAKDYFNVAAVPAIMANLRIERMDSATQLLTCADGRVKIVNLPGSPDALNPARVHYQVGPEGIDMTAELGTESPRIEKLLRYVQNKERGRQF